MTDIDLSLDEIIRKRNIRVHPSGPKTLEGRKPSPIKRLTDGPKAIFTPKKPVGDARLKIVRSQVRRQATGTDGATAIGDARFRLEALRSRNRPIRRPPNAAGPLRRSIHGRINNPLVGRGVPMDVDIFDFDGGRGVPLLRTVENEMSLFTRRTKRHFDWDRPLEEDDNGYRLDMLVDRYSAIRPAQEDEDGYHVEMPVDRLGRNSAVRSGFRPGAPDWDDISITVKTPHTAHAAHSPGILKRPAPAVAPPAVVPRALAGSALTLSERFNRDRSAEAAAKVEALKAQLKAAKGEPPVAKAESGTRIVVSNLVPSVTHEDVKELFGDIGELVNSKLVRPGVAEVVYKDHEDALKAVDVYHNRQLDGQPMKCLLVKNQVKRSGRTNVELDIATLRNALHKKVAT